MTKNDAIVKTCIVKVVSNASVDTDDCGNCNEKAKSGPLDLFQSWIPFVQVCYNLVLQSAPFDMDHDDHYHWHLEVIPRIARLAGFELLTRQYVNSVSPKKAAEDLNSAR